MLGSAQAQTTVGINISGGSYGTYAYYNGALVTSYFTGFPVTATAFGVAASDWKLTGDPQPTPPTATGTPYPYYGPASGSIQAGPGGALTVSWTAVNTWGTQIGASSGSGSGATFAPPAGNDEVTWGILDNTGWSIALSGLNAAFPHGYVIQGIGAGKINGSSRVNIADGISYNDSLGFSPIYTVDGNSVGLQTPTPTLTSDSITLSNPARPDATACGLSGFIITDKPVISRSPVNVSVPPGQAINLNVTAIGVGTLSYQWRTNGVNISGANSATYTKPNASLADSVNFDVIVTGTYGMVTSAVAAVTVAIPAPVTFDADTGTAGAQDGNGTWDLVTANWWSGSSNSVWGDLDFAVLGAGGVGNYTINLANSVTTSGLTFNANYNLTNAAGQSITLVGPAGIMANSNVTLNVAVAGTDGLTKTGNGTLTLNKQCPYTGSTTVSGGTLSLGVGGGGGTLQGDLTINSNATVLCSVNNALGYSGSYWVTNINLNFGTLTTATATDNGWGLQVNMTGATIGTTVPGGYFAMGGSPVVNVTGTNISSVISADMTVRDASPGGIVFNVTRGTAATDLKITGSLRASGTGGITLNGGGITELSGTNTYSGGTAVNGGTLTVSGQLTGDGMITLADNTTLNVTAAGAAPAINTVTAGLNIGNGNGPNTLGFAGLSSTNVAPINLGGYVNGFNTIAVKILSLNPVVGSYPLIHAAGGGYLAAGALTLPSGYTGSLSNDISGPSQTLYVNITGVPLVPVSIVTDLSGTTDQRYAGATYTLSVVPYGTPPFTYLWTHDGTSVGSNSPTLVLTNLTGTDAGAYTVKITNALAAVQSATNHLVVVQPPGYDAVVLATGPSAYWPLNETSGSTAYDVWGNDNAGYSGGVTKGVPGPVGTTGVTLNGIAGTKIVAPYSAALNPNGDFTVECWISPADVTNTASRVLVQSMINGENPGNANDRSGWCFRQNGGTLTFLLGGTTGSPFYTTTATSGSVLTAGTWQYVAAVYTAATTNISITVNSTEVLNLTGAEPLIPNFAAPIIIGDRGYGGWLYAGSISGVALYNRALTPSELTSHANYTASTAPSLITVTRSGADLILSWTSGNLQAAPEVTGTFTNVPAATSPYTVTPTEARKFFRLVN